MLASAYPDKHAAKTEGQGKRKSYERDKVSELEG